MRILVARQGRAADVRVLRAPDVKRPDHQAVYVLNLLARSACWDAGGCRARRWKEYVGFPGVWDGGYDVNAAQCEALRCTAAAVAGPIVDRIYATSR